MSQQVTITPRDSPVGSRSTGFTRKHDYLLVLICLALVELITFGINAHSVGVYQDEWICFGALHFVPHTLSDIFWRIFWDARYVVRPLEAFYYAPLYYLVGEKPFWYHVFCYACEFAGGFFLYLASCRLTSNKTVALAAALLFLLYPTHDATHYYITAASEQVSASFFTLSLWLYLRALDEEKFGPLLLSGLAYLGSVYNYEQTLPLLIMYPMLAVLKLGKQPSRAKVSAFAAYQIPFGSVAVSMVVFRQWILPSIGLGWHYQTVYSISNFLTVMGSGLNVSLSPYLLSFCCTIAADALKEGLSFFCWLCLSGAILLAFASAFLLGKKPSSNELRFDENIFTGKTSGFALMLVGAVTLICSYTIFGFSPEHMPVLDAWRNRVNICGSLGACLILAGSLDALFALPISRKVASLAISTVLGATVGLLVLVNWQFAKPWVISWHTQKELAKVIRNHGQEIKPGDSIIVGGITRYVRWAPVVDGVWDFQNLVRTTLNNDKIQANVITPRLSVEENALVDRSGILVLGTYPYKRMILYSPATADWVRVSSRQQFLDWAHKFGWSLPVK